MTGLDEVCARVREASRELGRLPTHRKDEVLREMADALERRAGEILRESRQDVDAAKRSRAGAAAIDRLLLDEDRVAEMAAGVRAVAGLPDPVGETEGGRRLVNGLRIERRRVPLGVVAVVYEGRPNVTVDAAALCAKSGNAVILRGGRAAYRTNRILAEVLTGALLEAGAPRWSLALLGPDRDELRRLVAMEGGADLVVARGGPGLRAFLAEHSRVPVITASTGTNHVYVHADADPEMALRIAVSSAGQRPGACNAARALLVHRDAAPAVLPAAAERLGAAGVVLRVDRAALDALGAAGEGLAEATEADYGAEFADLALAVRVVDSLDRALDHIARHGSGHSEAIVTSSLDAARRFQEGVDAAAVYVNASLRFTDGGQFGMGAEIGISTQKVHARGPIGLRELTTHTYLVTGDGHVR